VKCAVFQGLNAGRTGMNFIKHAHISKGLERFARDFREIVESPLFLFNFPGCRYSILGNTFTKFLMFWQLD
jgi:hypothetical protein